ncbi:MAG: PilT/PilU family type 4a pilus ATPase [Acidimicrobiales bacterium]
MPRRALRFPPSASDVLVVAIHESDQGAVSPFFKAVDVDPAIAAVGLDELLEHLCLSQGSDLHVKVGARPHIRVGGRLEATSFPMLVPADVERMAAAVLVEDRAEEFARTNEADVAFSIGGLGRFRVNVYRQRGTVALVFRRVATLIPGFAELGVPDVVGALADEHRGLILVTGPTGSGKTTTVAAMIDHINHTRAVSVVTIEDPIEFVFNDDKALVNQREVGSDTGGFAEAMRRVLRQDPDVIFIGEMRDPETVQAALAAAETGHLVLSTLHTADAIETVNRIVDFFPSHQSRQIRLSLATSLRGIVSQRLLERRDRQGRVPAVEVLLNTGRVADRIIDPSVGGDAISEIMADGAFYGMQTFDQSLFALIRDGWVTVRDAMASATNPHDLRIALQRAGVLSPKATGTDLRLS